MMALMNGYETAAQKHDQGVAHQRLWSAVVLAALDEAIADNQKYADGYGSASIRRWALSSWGQMVMSMAGISTSTNAIDGMVEFVEGGIPTSRALSGSDKKSRTKHAELIPVDGLSTTVDDTYI